jgi:ankyrin repeat protein
MKPLRKINKSSSNDSKQSAEITPGGGLNRAQLIQQSIPDRAIEYIKSGNIEALAGMTLEGSSELPMLSKPHSKTGMLPLGVAADEGRWECVDALIAAQIPVNLVDNQCMTPLLYAAKGGDMKIVEMLLKAQADVNIKHEPSGENALFMASKFNRINVVKYLIEQKEQLVEFQNTKDETPLWNALKNEHFDLAKLLLSHGAKVNFQQPATGNSPLHCVAFNGRITTLKFVLDNGGEVNMKNNNGDTSLSIACRHSSIPVVEELIRRGAFVNCQDNLGKTPLVNACLTQQFAVIKYLLTHKADPNIIDKWRYSPLMFICRIPQGSASSEIAQDLITAGANIYQMDNCFNTPLMHACTKGNMAVAKLLLEQGANAKLENMDGHTARDLIKNCEDREFFDKTIQSCCLVVESNTSEEGTRKPAWLTEVNHERANVATALAQMKAERDKRSLGIR